MQKKKPSIQPEIKESDEFDMSSEEENSVDWDPLEREMKEKEREQKQKEVELKKHKEEAKLAKEKL